MRIILIAAVSFLSFELLAGGVNTNVKRSMEIRELMWNQSGEEFKATEIPDKWVNESAVYLAKDIRLAYRKEPILPNLKYHHYTHYRIKVLTRKAIEEFGEFSITGGGTMGGVQSASYAGFKVIKADGREVEVSLDQMVKQNAQLNNRRLDVYKLAIPDLEQGDIIDYYLAEEQIIQLSSTKYYAFDPVIYAFNDPYPIVKQRISFDVLRRCFINLKTLNGAPKFRLTTDEKNDRNRYELVDSDRESVEEIRWLHKYREIPTIKFKVTYASPTYAQIAPTFLGEPGKLKSKVNNKELIDFLKYLFNYYKSSELYEFQKLMKKNFKGVKDKQELAKKAFYILRYFLHVKGMEEDILEGRSGSPSNIGFISTLSSYYRSNDIKHEILVGIPRDISKIDDLILENELTYAMRVIEGGKAVYISYFDENAYYGELDTELQGSAVVAVKGHINPSGWELRRLTLPIDNHDKNHNDTHYIYSIDDLKEGAMSLEATRSITGALQNFYQQYLTDFYTYKEEEREANPYHEEFIDVSKRKEAQLITKRSELLRKRQEALNGTMKQIAESDFDLEINEVTDFQIEQSGRYDDRPELVYHYIAKLEGAIKKVGPNYIVEIGKLIDSQVNLVEGEETREFNIYMPFARLFSYKVELEIPQGYELQGIDKLTNNVVNETGGFTSEATIEGNKLVINSEKFYTSNFVPAEKWNLMLQYLTAAEEFGNTQVLLKKKS